MPVCRKGNLLASRKISEVVADIDFVASDFTGSEWIDRISGYGIDSILGSPTLTTRNGVPVVVSDGIGDVIGFERFNLTFPFTCVIDIEFELGDTLYYGNWKSEGNDRNNSSFRRIRSVTPASDIASDYTVGTAYKTLRTGTSPVVGANRIMTLYPDGTPPRITDGITTVVGPSIMTSYNNQREVLFASAFGYAPEILFGTAATARLRFWFRELDANDKAAVYAE